MQKRIMYIVIDLNTLMASQHMHCKIVHKFVLTKAGNVHNYSEMCRSEMVHADL